MAYDKELAARVRKALAPYTGVVEIKMFGGLCFTVRGNMCCGVLNDDLVLRVSPESAARCLTEPHARPMDFTGRPMKNFLYIGPRGCANPRSLKKWLKRGIDFATSLPPKA